jgi:hypothetical protein
LLRFEDGVATVACFSAGLASAVHQRFSQVHQKFSYCGGMLAPLSRVSNDYFNQKRETDEKFVQNS